MGFKWICDIFPSLELSESEPVALLVCCTVAVAMDVDMDVDVDMDMDMDMDHWLFIGFPHLPTDPKSTLRN